MKVRIATALFAMALGATSTFAQKGVEDGSRFGHGQDSLNCLKNISIYQEYVKTNNFKDAYPSWKAVITEAPLAQMRIYTDGSKILGNLIAQASSAAQQKAYLDELMGVYDQRIKYLDKLNGLVSKPSTKGDVLGRKAHDYITYSGPNVDANKAYDMLKEAIDLEKEGSEYFVLQEFLDMSSRKLKTDNNHKEQFIQDYLLSSEYAEKGMQAQKKQTLIDAYKATKDNLDAFFINSGVATCDNLQEIYAPKVEANKNNLDYLKNVLAVMKMLGCNESEAYFAASEHSFNLSPSADAAFGCGAMYYKKGDSNKALEFFEKAIQLEEDNSKKADNCYYVAAILAQKKQYGQARTYAQKALSLNPSMGKAQILVAHAIAATAGGYSDPVLRGAVYCAAYDAALRAKSIDESVSAEATKLAGSFRSGFPSRDDVFMDPKYNEGQSISVSGVTTTLRCK